MIGRLVMATVLLCASSADASSYKPHDCSSSADNLSQSDTDVFLVAGQSNATGIPDDAIGSPLVPDGKVLQYYHGRIAQGNDPVGNAEPGSAWPQFGITYNERTGRRVLFVPASVPASSMVAAGDFFGRGHWDVTGKLFDNAVVLVAEALRAYGPHARFSGVLWDQGEADGLAINLGHEKASEYKAATEKLIARFRAQFGPDMPFFIFQTGVIPGKDPSGPAEVRLAQAQISREMALSPMVFDGAVTFPFRKMMARNGPHYTQAGYNVMGREGASNVASYYQPHGVGSCKDGRGGDGRQSPISPRNH